MNFPRRDPTLQEQIPLLEAVMNAIVHLAVKWGSAKTTSGFSIHKTTRRSKCAGCVWNADRKRTL